MGLYMFLRNIVSSHRGYFLKDPGKTVRLRALAEG